MDQLSVILKLNAISLDEVLLALKNNYYYLRAVINDYGRILFLVSTLKGQPTYIDRVPYFH